MSDKSGPDRWMPLIAMISGLRSIMGGPESTIRTNEDYKDRPIVSLKAFGNLVLGGCVGFTAITLHLWAWLEIAGVNASVRVVWPLFLGCCLALALPSAALAKRFGLGMLDTYLMILASVWVLAFGVLIMIAPESEGASLLWTGVALVLALASLPFCYHNFQGLRRPYWPRSPYEEAIQRDLFPSLAAMMMQGEEGMSNRLRVPYTINGMHRDPLIESTGNNTVFITKEDRALLEFIEEAARRGLSRRQWLRKKYPNVTLPISRIEVTREMYDQIIEELTKWQIVRPGGAGKSARWILEPNQAIEKINQEIISQIVEGHVV